MRFNLTGTVGIGGTAGLWGAELNDLLLAGGGEVRGLGGADLLIANGPGTLRGGDGRDTFLVGDGTAPVRITDFRPGADQVNLSMIAQQRDIAGDLVADTNGDGTVTLADFTFTQVNATTVRIGGAANMTLRNVNGLTVADVLDPDNFVFESSTSRTIDSGTGAPLLGGTDGANLIVAQNGAAAGPAQRIFMLGGKDLLIGGTGRETADLGQGDDTAFGGAGADYINGSSGNDLLIGGTGADTLIGGSGGDVFVIDTNAFDVIFDFGNGTDRIILDNGGAGTSLGDLTFQRTQPGVVDIFTPDGGFITVFGVSSNLSIADVRARITFGDTDALLTDIGPAGLLL